MVPFRVRVSVANTLPKLLKTELFSYWKI